MFDVVIIGAGSAGLAARREVSQQTSNYLVVDPGPFGTTCARVGCMPSKVLIEAGEMLAQVKKFATIGVSLPEAPVIDGRRLMAYVRDRRDHYVGHVIADMQEWRTTHLLEGKAKFIDPETIEVSGKRIRARRFIVATGSRPLIPVNWSQVKGLRTTDDIFELENLPRSLVVIGTGPVGLELGHAFARFGVQVTAVGELRKIGHLSDDEIISDAVDKFREEMKLVDGSVEDVQLLDGLYHVKVGDQNLTAEQVLVAVGREPNLTGLDLEKSGARRDAAGKWLHNGRSFRLEGSNSYFVGDVNGARPILHEAVDQGRIAAMNALSAEDHEFPCRVRLSIVFTQPQIAVVGFAKAQLDEKRLGYSTGRASFRNQGRAVAKLENFGQIKVYADLTDGKILGAEIFGPGAEHLGHLLAWAIEAKRSVFCLLTNAFYHPTLEEALRTALKNAAKGTQDGARKLSEIRCDDAPAGISD